MKIYIIPGWEDSGLESSYKKLAEELNKNKYKVVIKSVNWKKPLSSQIFKIKENDIIFGFSLGAILAWLIAQKYKCQHLILASMTPHYSFTDKKIKKSLIDLTGKDFTEDIIKNLNKKNKAQKQTIMYGDREDEMADILVKNTDHEITDNYIKEIIKLIQQNI